VQESMLPNYRYVGMNNNSINITMRKAISYAINYSDLVEYVTEGRGIQVRSPIPAGCLYSNTTAFDLPEYNITHARKLLKDAGWPGTATLNANDNVSAGNEWEMLVINDTPLETYNFSYFDNPLHLRHAVVLPEYLKQIGIKLEKDHNSSFNSQIFIFGWVLDYNDPHNALYSTFDYYNFMELNDSLIEEWMNDGIKETNTTIREQIYYNIQERIIEVLYPVAWTCSPFKYEIHVSNLKAFQPNPYKTVLKNAYFV
ncbi:MAG: ABC transporter substrate-binding protein, partial [Promethearchaeota archaeon]